ncbi:MAG: PilZ domain-containing protein [Sphingobium sp.]
MSFVDRKSDSSPAARKNARQKLSIVVKLRRPGESWFSTTITNLSQDGFCIDSFVTLEPGMVIWIMFAGFEGRRATVMWIEGHQAGCRFDTPLHVSVLDHIIG